MKIIWSPLNNNNKKKEESLLPSGKYMKCQVHIPLT